MSQFSSFSIRGLTIHADAYALCVFIVRLLSMTQFRRFFAHTRQEAAGARIQRINFSRKKECFIIWLIPPERMNTVKIQPFAVEEWMNAYETRCRYNIAETCVDSISLDQLFELAGQDRAAFFRKISSVRLTYGDIEGYPPFLEGIARLYRNIQPSEVVVTHGAAGANHHLFYSLIEPGDHVVTVVPTYQQLTSIPASFGARVDTLRLRSENHYLPDPAELRALVTPETRLICINNPNNPTGSLMPPALLNEIVQIARDNDCYLLCDEVYRLLTQEPGELSPSIADLYEKGISVSSMSKVFSLAGLRLGWIATRDSGLRAACLSHRDYNHISCGLFDERVAAIALVASAKLLERSRGIIRENLQILDDFIHRQPHLQYVRPSAGTTALVRYDLAMDSRQFCTTLCERYGALVTPGDCFDEPRTFRIGYACRKEELEQGLAALERMLRDCSQA